MLPALAAEPEEEDDFSAQVRCAKFDSDYARKVPQFASDCQTLFDQLGSDQGFFTSATIQSSRTYVFSYKLCHVQVDYPFGTRAESGYNSIELWEWMERLFSRIMTDCVSQGYAGYATSFYENRIAWSDHWTLNVDLNDDDSDIEDERDPLIPPPEDTRISLSTTNETFQQATRLVRIWNNVRPCFQLCDFADKVSKARCMVATKLMGQITLAVAAVITFALNEHSTMISFGDVAGLGAAIYSGWNFLGNVQENQEGYDAFEREMDQNEAKKMCVVAAGKQIIGPVSILQGAFLVAAATSDCLQIGRNLAAAGYGVAGGLNIASGVLDSFVGWCIRRKSQTRTYSNVPSTLFISQTTLYTSPTPGSNGLEVVRRINNTS